MREPKAIDFTLLTILALIWASAFFNIKIATYSYGPLSISFFRIFFGALPVILICYLRKIKIEAFSKDWYWFAAIGIINLVIPFFLIAYGIQKVQSNLAAILMASTPLTAAILAHFFISNEKINWIRAGESEDKYALVVVSDIAKYDLGSSGEVTQGAGAIAMLLNEEPRLLSFDPKVTSTSIKNEYDFYRPFGKETPIVHGQYSNLLYLIQVKNALIDYKRRVKETGLIKLKEGETILDYVDYLNMHLPYSNMGKKALAYLVRHEWRDLPRWKKIIEEIGMEEPIPKDPRGTIESTLEDADFMANDHQFTKLFTSTEMYAELYESKLASSLIASKMIGNLYTASLYLGFRSSLEFEYQKGVDLEGKRVGFCSYGSGASAMIFSGVIQPEYDQVVKEMNLEAELGPRTKLSLDEYEELHENKRTYEENIRSANKEFVIVDVKTSTESRGERHYAFVD